MQFVLDAPFNIVEQTHKTNIEMAIEFVQDVSYVVIFKCVNPIFGTNAVVKYFCFLLLYPELIPICRGSKSVSLF